MSGANDLPARHTTGRTYGQHDKAAFADPSWTRGRGRSKPRGKVLGAASHSGDLLARSDLARRSPRGSQDAGVEHHPVRRAGSASRRRRLPVVPLPGGTILGGLRRRASPVERHPAASSATFGRVTLAMGRSRPVAHNVPLTCEGDVQPVSPSNLESPKRPHETQTSASSWMCGPTSNRAGEVFAESSPRHRRVTFRVTLSAHPVLLARPFFGRPARLRAPTARTGRT